MKNDSPGPEHDAGRDLREIPKWTDRYARSNRSVQVLVGVGFTWGLIALCSGFTLYAVQSHMVALICASLALNVLLAAGVIYLAFSGRLTKWVTRVGGYVIPASPSPAEMRRRRRFEWMLPLPLVALLVIARALGVPPQYWQPITAIYVVPALVYVVGRDGWADWPYLLWPALYLQHAVLVLAGVRLYVGVWYMDVFFPLGVYGMVGAVAAVVYSRYALRRLRTLARSPEAAGEPK
jgi:hypothetical protein